jgi:hypothetical protein
MTVTDVEIENALKDLTNSRKKNIPVTVGINLHEKLTKHLFLLRAINKRYSQSNWICEAITEGLDSEKIDGDLPKEKKLTISIDEVTLKKLEERVEFLKQINYSFSKKKWIVEAICKKLDRDTGKIKEEVQKLHTQKKERSTS